MKEHQHQWTVESRHRTSVGVVAYHSCACGARRIVEYELGSPTVVPIRSEASRSASMSPALSPGPVRSICRSMPILAAGSPAEVAQSFAIEMDHTPMPLGG